MASTCPGRPATSRWPARPRRPSWSRTCARNGSRPASRTGPGRSPSCWRRPAARPRRILFFESSSESLLVPFGAAWGKPPPNPLLTPCCQTPCLSSKALGDQRGKERPFLVDSVSVCPTFPLVRAILRPMSRRFASRGLGVRVPLAPLRTPRRPSPASPTRTAEPEHRRSGELARASWAPASDRSRMID